MRADQRGGCDEEVKKRWVKKSTQHSACMDARVLPSHSFCPPSRSDGFFVHLFVSGKVLIAKRKPKINQN